MPIFRKVQPLSYKYFLTVFLATLSAWAVLLMFWPYLSNTLRT